MIEVEAPDGTIIEFPDGTSEEVMLNAMRQAFGGQGAATQPSVVPPSPQPAPTDQPTEVEAIDVVAKERANRLKGGARAIAQGLTFNFADEIEAAVRSGKISGPEYKELRDRIRSNQAVYREQNPGEALALEVVPALATALIPGVGWARGAAMASKVPGLARAATAAGKTGNLQRAAMIGGTSGAVTGVGATEGDKFDDLGELGLNVAGTGALGAGLGVGVSAAGGVLANVAKGARQRGEGTVLKTLDRAGIEPEELAVRAQQDAQMGVPSVVGELDPGLVGLTRNTIEKMPDSPQRQALLKKYFDLTEDAPVRVEGRLQGVAPGGYQATRDNITTELKKIGDEDYTASYAVGKVDDPDIIKMVSSKTWAPIWKEAEDLAVKESQAAQDLAVAAGRRGEDGAFDPEAFKLRGAPVIGKDGSITVTEPPDVRTLDYLKRAMDAYIEKRMKSADGLSAPEAKALRNSRKAMLEVLDEVVPEYKTARSKYAGELEVRDALEIGRGVNVPDGKRAFETMPADTATKMLGEMSEAERQALRSGYVGKLIDAKKVPSPKQMDRLKMLFDDPGDADMFEAVMAAERKLGQERTALLSKYIPKDEDGDFSFPLVNQSATGQLSMFMWAARRFNNKDPAKMNRIAEIMAKGTPDEIEQVVKDLVKTRTIMRNDEATRGALALGAGVSSGAAPQRPEEVSTTGATSDVPVSEMSEEDLQAMTAGSFQDMSDEELEALVGGNAAPQQAPITSGAGAQEIIGSLGEDEALALTALGEASPNPAEQRAVIHTVLNRQKAGGFGNSLPEILRPDQFNAWEKAEELAAKRDTPQFKRALEIVRQVRAGELPDNTGGATHFYAPRAQAEGNAKNPKRYRSAVPSWAQGKEGRQIGATKFFAGV